MSMKLEFQGLTNSLRKTLIQHQVWTEIRVTALKFISGLGFIVYNVVLA